MVMGTVMGMGMAKTKLDQTDQFDQWAIAVVGLILAQGLI